MSNQSREKKEIPKNAEDYPKQEMKAEHEGAQQELKAVEAKMDHFETVLQNYECKLLEKEEIIKEKEDKWKKFVEELNAIKCIYGHSNFCHLNFMQ